MRGEERRGSVRAWSIPGVARQYDPGGVARVAALAYEAAVIAGRLRWRPASPVVADLFAVPATVPVRPERGLPSLVDRYTRPVTRTYVAVVVVQVVVLAALWLLSRHFAA